MIIPNKCKISFTCVLPDGQMLVNELDSNTVNTQALTYSVSKTANCDKTFLQEGETSKYCVVITNNSQTQLLDILFKDDISGATYVPGSLKINGVPQPTYDPTAGFTLPSLDSGQSITVEYDVKATNPLIQPIITNCTRVDYAVNDPMRGKVNFSESANPVTMQVVSNKVTVVKSVDKAYAIKGDNLHYTSIITNTGTNSKENLVFTDPIPAGTTFVVGSVKINGVSYPTYHPQTGFNLPNLAVGDAATVEFDATVN